MVKAEDERQNKRRSTQIRPHVFAFQPGQTRRLLRLLEPRCTQLHAHSSRIRIVTNGTLHGPMSDRYGR